jgi:flagellin-like hook-associated protein FlgL
VQLTGVSGEAVNIAVTGTYSVDDILATVNDRTSETGVQARMHGTNLIFETLDVGSNQSFSLKISNGTLNIDTKSISGRDVLVRVNGQQVQGTGWQVDYNAHDLSMSATISPSFQVGDRTQFRVEGGVLFQLGQNVHESMQHRMAMPSMTVSNLGGASGRLIDLQTIDLETDEGKALAHAIVTEAVNMVAVQRGTIGAVQKHVLTANGKNLDTLFEKVSEAEGLLANADMALESSQLRRAELLAQSALSAILYSRDFGQFIFRALL